LTNNLQVIKQTNCRDQTRTQHNTNLPKKIWKLKWKYLSKVHINIAKNVENDFSGQQKYANTTEQNKC